MNIPYEKVRYKFIELFRTICFLKKALKLHTLANLSAFADPVTNSFEI